MRMNGGTHRTCEKTAESGRSSRQRHVGGWLVLLLSVLPLLILTPSRLTFVNFNQATHSVRFAVIGDFGTGGEHQKKVADQMVIWHDRYGYEFVITVGDNIYPFANPKDYQKKFEIPYAELLHRGVRFYATLGNHDVKFGRWKYAVQYPPFNMNGQRYYTFTQGGGSVQFFALDSTTLSSGQRDETQLRWLRREFAASTARWKIAYFHHPLYSSGKWPVRADVKMRRGLEPLLIEGGVRVVFSGHDHVYERIAPQHGIYYFVTGSAGKLRRRGFDRRTGLTLNGNSQVRHFLFVEIEDSEMRFQAVSENGDLIDSGSIPAPVSSDRASSSSCWPSVLVCPCDVKGGAVCEALIYGFLVSF